MKHISKSKLLHFIQCPRLGFISINHSKEIPKPSKELQKIFKQGHEVGLVAQERFPEGILVDSPAYNQEDALKQTNDLIEKGALALFEPAFVFNGIFVRVDILVRESVNSPWSIIEVKSSTSISETYHWDIGIQYYVLSNVLKINNAYLWYINNQCYFPDLENLFEKTNMTQKCEELKSSIEMLIKKVNEVIKENRPEVNMGEHCSDPYACPLMSECKKIKNVPELSVFDLPRIGKKKWAMVNSGKSSFENLDLEQLSDTHLRIVKSTLNNIEIVDWEEVKSELDSLVYPISYLDFETEQKAVPEYFGTKPYQQIPFQYSLHIENENNALSHSEFLADGSDDRLAFITQLKKDLPTTGTIVSYNAPFEISRLKELAERFPEFKDWINSLLPRFWDPLNLFRKHYYHPDFQGSFSIKYVAPALLGKEAGYSHLDVQNGLMAQEVYEEYKKDNNIELEKGLKEYCKQDTYLMVRLVRHLRLKVYHDSSLQ